MTVILSTGLIAVDIQVGRTTIRLLADTGAEASLLPLHSLKGIAAGYQAIKFLIGGSAIYAVRMRGPTASATLESHNRLGRSTTATSKPVWAHALPAGTPPFVGFDGILGMDMLDDFGADAVKDASKGIAYLAQRS